ncbi:MAG: RNA 2',3'-cyclic phosphodiesterase [Sedimentisphaerales bacterium]
MRVFIAIDIDDKIRKAIADVQKQLNAKVDIRKGDVKWVEPDNIHLTLKFLGEIDDSKLSEVKEITEQVAAAHNKFNLDIESVGSFGGRSAKVVWVGAGKGTDELLALQKDLDEQLTLADFPSEDREFSAHLTICRVRNPKAGFKLAEAVGQFAKLKLGSIDADAVCVYQSQLTPDGPIYTQLASFKLI